MRIELGDEVEDLVTGFKGIAVVRHTFLYGMSTITVQPVVERYGYLSESENFAETALKVTKAKETVVSGLVKEFIKKETV